MDIDIERGRAGRNDDGDVGGCFLDKDVSRACVAVDRSRITIFTSPSPQDCWSKPTKRSEPSRVMKRASVPSRRRGERVVVASAALAELDVEVKDL